MSTASVEVSSRLGFAVWVRPRAGLPAWAEAEFEDRLDEYLMARGLKTDESTQHIVIRSDYRDLAAVDQVDLLDWLFDDDFPAAVRVGPLTPHVDKPNTVTDSIVLADRSDMALAPLSWLYRAHRITASQYLQILSNADAGWGAATASQAG